MSKEVCNYCITRFAYHTMVCEYLGKESECPILQELNYKTPRKETKDE